MRGSTWAHRLEKTGRSGGRSSIFAEEQIHQTTSEPRSELPLARDGCCPHREHAIQYVAPDESLWGTSAKERHATIGREGVSFTVNRNLRGKKGVVESSDTADESGAMF